MRKPIAITAALWLHRFHLGLAFGIFSVMGASAAKPRGTVPADPARVCLSAAQAAAQRHGVPFDVMHRITLVETGRQTANGMTPWPWAVHATGRGHWPATREGALAIIRTALAAGHSNIDIGCFQINYHWHSDQFPTLEAMLDPIQNADYAAQLLNGHYQRLGSWTAAAGAYHSVTPALAQRYIARFNAVAATAGPPPSSTPTSPQRRQGTQTNYALLQSAGDGKMGSLVSQSAMQSARPFLETGTQAP
ncbi:transglycosylase SLT domain-containing protein [Roseinatronobacter sp.]